MSLYHVAVSLQDSINNSFDEYGEINEKSLALIDEKNELMQSKCIEMSKYIRNLEAEYDAVKNAKEQMEDRLKRLKNNKEILESYLKDNMERCGIKEIKCPMFVIKIKKNPVSLDVFDENIIPMEFKKEIITLKVDKQLIKEKIKSGEFVSGCYLKQNNRLEIK